jgi:hypothetical protein
MPAQTTLCLHETLATTHACVPETSKNIKTICDTSNHKILRAEALLAHYKDLHKFGLGHRSLGHVVLSPPIGAMGSMPSRRDWPLFDLDSSTSTFGATTTTTTVRSNHFFVGDYNFQDVSEMRDTGNLVAVPEPMGTEGFLRLFIAINQYIPIETLLQADKYKLDNKTTSKKLRLYNSKMGTRIHVKIDTANVYSL